MALAISPSSGGISEDGPPAAQIGAVFADPHVGSVDPMRGGVALRHAGIGPHLETVLQVVPRTSTSAGRKRNRNDDQRSAEAKPIETSFPPG